MERKNSKGDTLYPTEFQITPNEGFNWENPKIVVHSIAKDSRDGELYIQKGVEPDRASVLELVEKGIWTEEEATSVVELILKAYVLIGA